MMWMTQIPPQASNEVLCHVGAAFQHGFLFFLPSRKEYL